MTTPEKILGPHQVIGTRQACDLLGIRKTTFFKLKATDRAFPKPVNLGGRLGFIVGELAAYARKLQRRRQPARPNPNPAGSRRRKSK